MRILPKHGDEPMGWSWEVDGDLIQNVEGILEPKAILFLTSQP